MSHIFLNQFYYLWFWIFFCPLWIREWNQGEDGQKNKKLCKSRRGTFSSCGWAVWAKMAASGLRGEQSWTRAAIKAEVVTVGQNKWAEQKWVLLFMISAFVFTVADYVGNSGRDLIITKIWPHFYCESVDCGATQRYTYRVLQTIQMKLILLCVWAELAVLGSPKAALKFKYEI